MSAERTLGAGFVLVLLLSGCPSKAPGPAGQGEVQAARPASGEATLLLMADIRGVLRPCGCTKELRKGGFDRLGPQLAKERARSPGALVLHAGPLFFDGAAADPKKAAQRDRQASVAAQLIGEVRVDVAGLSAVDVAAAADGVLPTLVERSGAALTVANVTLNGGPAAPRFVVREVGSLRVGVIALAAPAHAAALGERGEISDPKDGARAAVAELADRADVVVLLSALGLRETKRLMRKVSGIHFAVAGGMDDHASFTDEAEPVGGGRVLQLHREGRFVGRLDLRVVDGDTDFVDRAELADGATAKGSSFSFSLAPLDWDLPQDPALLAKMDAFDAALQKINLAAAGALPTPKPGEAVYVGEWSCLDCHDQGQGWYEAHPHHQAWETLEKLNKTFDAECVSCHVTGYGRAGGSLVGQTVERQDVQCESCHGPGSLHALEGAALETLAPVTEATCVGCHNLHHSPRFDFAKYRKRLIAPGHGQPVAGTP